MRQVITGVQTAFVDSQYANENLKLAQNNLKGLEGVPSINEARRNSGEVAQVELDLSRVAQQLQQSKSRLQLLMGRSRKSSGFEVSGETRKDAATPTASGLERLALCRRPDYLSYLRNQARSRADLRLQLVNAKADYVIGTEYTHQSAWGMSGNSLGPYFMMPLRVFSSLIEYLEAQRAFNDAMQTWNEARANYSRSLNSIGTIFGAVVSGS